MKNIELLKKELCEQIIEMTDEELYSHILQPEPLISGLCKYCRSLWGECPDTIENDSICRFRFKQWCEIESDKMNSNPKV